MHHTQPNSSVKSLTAVMMCIALLFLTGCGKEKTTEIDPHKTLPTSLHATTQGMSYWYMDGLFQFTGIDYNDLSCKNCHTESCSSCHDVDSNGEPVIPGKETDPTTCYTCHSRQKFMQMKFMAPQGEQDVHFAMGMKCGDCHTMKEIHGDGKTWNSMLDEGFFEVNCEKCHEARSDITEHLIHAGKQLKCSACHMRKAIACYNCHFNAEVMYDKKVAHKPISDFILLVKDRRDNKISPGTIMAVDYLTEVTDPATFKAVVAVAPFYSHTITSTGRRCDDCHANEAVTELQNTGQIIFTWWDDSTQSIMNKKGVIPYVEGKLLMTFVRPLTPDAEPQCGEMGCSYPQWVSAGTSENLGDSYLEHKIAAGLSAEEIENLSSPK